NLRYGGGPDQVVTEQEMWEALRVAAAGIDLSGPVVINLRYGGGPDQVVTEQEMWEALRVAAAGIDLSGP
ncbi:hypothetical protein GR254_25185, partial [Mycobacterium tuberculosis]|nr:hypothetical protein [Mycobacterium tuberculosis]